MSNLSLNSNIGVIIPSAMEKEHVDVKRFLNEKIIFRNSGMGKVNVALEVADMSEYCDQIVLAGFCGGLRGLAMGEIVTATVVYDGDHHAEPFDSYPKTVLCKSILVEQIKQVPFVSQDSFLTKDDYKNDPVLKWVSPLATDMETFAFVKACLRFGVEPFVVKVVSDLVTDTAAKDFTGSCARYAERMNVSIDMMVSEINMKGR